MHEEKPHAMMTREELVDVFNQAGHAYMQHIGMQVIHPTPDQRMRDSLLEHIVERKMRLNQRNVELTCEALLTYGQSFSIYGVNQAGDPMINYIKVPYRLERKAFRLGCYMRMCARRKSHKRVPRNFRSWA